MAYPVENKHFHDPNSPQPALTPDYVPHKGPQQRRRKRRWLPLLLLIAAAIAVLMYGNSRANQQHGSDLQENTSPRQMIDTRKGVDMPPDPEDLAVAESTGTYKDDISGMEGDDSDGANTPGWPDGVKQVNQIFANDREMEIARAIASSADDAESAWRMRASFPNEATEEYGSDLAPEVPDDGAWHLVETKELTVMCKIITVDGEKLPLSVYQTENGDDVATVFVPESHEHYQFLIGGNAVNWWNWTGGDELFTRQFDVNGTPVYADDSFGSRATPDWNGYKPYDYNAKTWG